MSGTDYQRLFEHAAVPILEVDIGKLRGRIAAVHRESDTEMKAHLVEHPGFILEAADLLEVTEVNDAGLRLFEADDKARLLGPLGRVFGAGARAALTAMIMAIDEGRSDIEVESAAETLTGKTFVLSLQGRIPPGAHERMFLTLVDITARTDALLWDSHLFDILMENLPDHIYFKDRMSRFLRISTSLARALGLNAPFEAIGRTDVDFYGEEHAAEALRDEQQILQSGIPLVDIEERESFRDRPETWALTTKMPLEGLEGNVIGTFGVSHDITHRKQLEDRNQQLATLVEYADDAIVGVDRSHMVFLWNKGAERIYGYTAMEMVGQPADIIVPPDLRDGARANWERVLSGQSISHFETSRMRKDCTCIEVSLSLFTLRDAVGAIIGLAAISRDITEQRALEKRIERVRRLEDLATLAGGVAHQFNNINTAVKAYLDLLRPEKGVPEKLMAYVEGASQGVQKAVSITDRLLALTEPSAAAAQPLRLDLLARKACALHEARMREEEVLLVEDIAECPPVRGNEPRLLFVLTSLIANALDSLLGLPARMVTVRTGGTRDGAFFSVEDGGCGIPPEDLPRIFSPFFSGKGEWAPRGSPQARVKGVGLSLAISGMTVSEYGGRIDVKSVPGTGSTFTVVMPAAGPDG